ncbi:hypothetical protein SELMODRAFT_403121 [Selaginella moellendorffii]|uniref:Crinkler (CRN) family protein n=1 Tax=Selaginella moellendorffii TaxID=88036 RepID=D8QP45_SELML|nr:hypothetical protein SELMODRAFT_403121 [Selaginella moellendorffii]
MDVEWDVLLFYCIVSAEEVEPSGHVVQRRGTCTGVAAGTTFSGALEAVQEAAGAKGGDEVHRLRFKPKPAWVALTPQVSGYVCQKGDELFFRVTRPVLPTKLKGVPAGVASLARAGETDDQKFWILDRDPLGNFVRPFLLWKRKAYTSLETKLLAETARIFIVLGTGGTGKTFFGYHWITRLGQMGHERVLYKKEGATVYVLNLRRHCVEGAYDMDDKVITDMLDDPSLWLVIDGKQKAAVEGVCKILLTCSTQKSNYGEFGKSGDCLKLYISVWSREEVEAFFSDFEVHRRQFESMKVVDKTTALEAFDYLGGVARYILTKWKLKDGKDRVRDAVQRLGSNVQEARIVLCGGHLKNVSDCVLHIVASDDDLEVKSRRFASEALMKELGEQYIQAGVAAMVKFLKHTFSCPWVGGLWGKLYESLVHRLLSRGGNFRVKEVFEDGRRPAETSIAVAPHVMEEANSAVDLKAKMGKGKYVKPTSETLPCAMDDNILVQVFKKRDVKASGLEKVDAVLKKNSYNLWSCVPKETYPLTGWQDYKSSSDGGVHGKDIPVLQKMRQFVVAVDYEDARRLLGCAIPLGQLREGRTGLGEELEVPNSKNWRETAWDCVPHVLGIPAISRAHILVDK